MSRKAHRMPEIAIAGPLAQQAKANQKAGGGSGASGRQIHLHNRLRHSQGHSARQNEKT
jgi:hypothetical protein